MNALGLSQLGVETRQPTDLLASVIVPARNAGGTITELLAGLRAQTLPRERFEVIIGDDGSDDDSIREFATDDGWIQVSAGPRLNSYAARNRAARLAGAPVLAFCDVDCKPEPAWLEVGLKALEEADLGGGRVRLIVPPRPSVWTLLDIDLHVDQERAVRNGKALGGNLFVRSELFEEMGGFDDSLSNTGDYEFVSRCVASGARLVFIHDAVVWHPTHNHARPLLRKIWRIQRTLGLRGARAGRRPKVIAYSSIPIVGMLRSRRSEGRPLRLDRRRLAANGVAPRPLEDLKALPILYLVIPYLARAARIRGWWLARSED